MICKEIKRERIINAIMTVAKTIELVNIHTKTAQPFKKGGLRTGNGIEASVNQHWIVNGEEKIINRKVC